jgi:aryl-alcohol dehydrogenase-like predicted oxidoreductase
MKQRPLGQTGLSISEIGLGTWAFGSPVYGATTIKESNRVIRGAVDRGITLFDTAPLYGSQTEDGVAESVLGEALGAQRDRVIISTKFGRTSTRPFPPRFNAREVRASVEASLGRIKRDHIDILFFHSPFSPAEIEEDVWPECERLRSEGKVCWIGHSVSEFEATADLCREWVRRGRIQVIQVVLSPFNRQARELIADCASCGVGVLARECLANGFLTGTVRRDSIFAAGTVNARYAREEIVERVEYAERLETCFAAAGSGNLPEGAYRWVLNQKGVSSALSGARSLLELEAAIRGADAPRLTAEECARLEEMHLRDFSAA